MMSVVCVYSSERSLNEILRRSLDSQNTEFEFIPVDNTARQFKSAAQALNHGGLQAKGKYVMFVHQDVGLGSPSWLEDTERLLDSLPDLGIAGVIGMTGKGTNIAEMPRGQISDCGIITGRPLAKAEEVQTLDECLLIVPRSVFAATQFDERTFDGWHLYGADYCLSVKELGLKSYVVPAFIYHRSLRQNLADLLEYQKRLYAKHRRNTSHIYTTVGEISWVTLRSLSLTGFVRPPYMRVFPQLGDLLKREIHKDDTVLDVGCSYNSPIQHCNVRYSVGVEKVEPHLEESRSKHIHSEYIVADMRDIPFEPKSFDVVVAFNVLERLTKEDGIALIGRMSQCARKKVVLTTMSGLAAHNLDEGKPCQGHKAAWHANELRQLGFDVRGIAGWKHLQCRAGQTKYRHPLLWRIASDLTQVLAYHFPNAAYQLMAVKRNDG